MNKCLLFLSILLCSATAFAQTDTTQQVIANRRNSPKQQQKPYVILISADGFRYDYADKYNATTLKRLRAQGVEAESMLPSFPSKTFPNHYTIVTGMYPATHGLINNYFYDPNRKVAYTLRDRNMVEDGSWYGGVPLWVLAERQQMLTASYYWVGSEAPIQGVLPTYHYKYSEKTPFEGRIKTVVNWLELPEEKRPHLITLYIPEVDHAGHLFGPNAPETEAAVLALDKNIQKLTAAVAATGLPVNYIFVSDHGMAEIDRDNTLPLPAAVDTAKFIVSGGEMVVELHAKQKRDIKPTYRQLKKEAQGYSVYRKGNMPRHLHYGAREDAYKRLGDILLITEAPTVFNLNNRRPAPATHGFDPCAVKEMHATFYAWGPSFKKGVHIPSFRNTEVYPLVAALLGLPYTHKIDGKATLVKKLLQ